MLTIVKLIKDKTLYLFYFDLLIIKGQQRVYILQPGNIRVQPFLIQIIFSQSKKARVYEFILPVSFSGHLGTNQLLKTLDRSSDGAKLIPS